MPGADTEHADPPATDADPRAQAQYLIDMLDAFAQQGTQEAKRLRVSVVEAVSVYTEMVKENREQATEVFKSKIVGFEVTLSKLLVTSTTKIRDHLRKQSRKVGTGSAAGKAMRTGAEGMEMVVDAMNTMLKGASANDPILRKKARELMDQARTKLAPLNSK